MILLADSGFQNCRVSQLMANEPKLQICNLSQGNHLLKTPVKSKIKVSAPYFPRVSPPACAPRIRSVQLASDQ